MKKVMEQPEVKSKMEEFQKEQTQLRQREYAMVYKAMDRRQVSTFKKMLGKAFDVDSLMAGFFRGGPGRGNRPGATAPDASKSATAKAEPAPTTPDTTSTPKASAPRRQSLRERRGLGGQQPAPSDSPN
jgi:hypothetical protein